MGNKFAFEQKVEEMALEVSDAYEYADVDTHFRDVLKGLKPVQQGLGWPYILNIIKIRAA